MKARGGFVSNSSSTSFIITNTSDRRKTLVNFVEENPQLIKDFIIEYDWYRADKYNQEALLASAKANNIIFAPGAKLECVFGDEDGTLIGQVFDYILRDGGRSKSFTWKYHEALR